ncbi:MAG TPA: TIGR01620 family protein, partial [Sulfitobacter sp.]|nr:TIGR01620 family protein [Sulfitobacter sp.]
MARGPILFDLEEDAKPQPSVADAPAVPELDVEAPPPKGQAMQIAARLAARKPSRLVRMFWALAGALVTALVSIAAWTFVTDLMARYPLLGWAMTLLIGVFLLVLLLLSL